MKKLRIALFACASLLIISILLIKGFGGHAAHAAPASSTCGSWSIVHTPIPPRIKLGSSFHGTVSLSANDVWNVGDYNVVGGENSLTEHWNGSQWGIVSSPNVLHAEFTELDAVAAVSPNNIWAVGYSYISGSGPLSNTLIEHWNGLHWHIVASPNPGAGGNNLRGVVAISPNNIWAVGEFQDSSDTFQTLIEHWNGSSWSVVSSPNIGTGGSELSSVTAVASNDIWAVGFGATVTLTEHWNGTQWSIISSPNAGTSSSALNGVTAIASNNVWAVGDYITSSDTYQTLIEQWNGTSWSVVASPDSGTSFNQLLAVSAASANTIWAVGTYNTTKRTQALIEQWNGTSWNVVASPPLAHNGMNGLNAVSTIPGSSQAWVVGNHVPPGANALSVSLTEYYC